MSTFKGLTSEEALELEKKLYEIFNSPAARKKLGKPPSEKKLAQLKRLNEINKASGRKLRPYRQFPVYFKGETVKGKWLISNNKNYKQIFNTREEALKKVNDLNQWLRPGHPFRVQPKKTK